MTKYIVYREDGMRKGKNGRPIGPVWKPVAVLSKLPDKSWEEWLEENDFEPDRYRAAALQGGRGPGHGLQSVWQGEIGY
jgi:hypothetical protein